MKKITPLFLLTLFIFISGCGDSSAPQSVQKIYSLNKGNTWVYQYSLFDSSHILIYTKPDTIRIGVIGSIWGENSAQITHSYKKLYDTTWNVLKSDGLWEFTWYPLFLKYKYPTITNDTFNVSIDSGFGNSGTIYKNFTRTVSTAESVNVPAGNFSCIHYRSHYQVIDSTTKQILNDYSGNDEYVCQGIGLVKQSTGYSVGGPGQEKQYFEERLLLSYSLK